MELLGGSRRATTEGYLMLTPTEVAHRYVELLAAGDLAGLGDLFQDDVTWRPAAATSRGPTAGRPNCFRTLESSLP